MLIMTERDKIKKIKKRSNMEVRNISFMNTLNLEDSKIFSPDS